MPEMSPTRSAAPDRTSRRSAAPDRTSPRSASPDRTSTALAENHGRRCPARATPRTRTGTPASTTPIAPTAPESVPDGSTTVITPHPPSRANGADPARGGARNRPVTKSSIAQPVGDPPGDPPGDRTGDGVAAPASAPAIPASTNAPRYGFGRRDDPKGAARASTATRSAAHAGTLESPAATPTAYARAKRAMGAARVNSGGPTRARHVRIFGPRSPRFPGRGLAANGR